ncbi:MAG: endonuclease/exonuclease/phosphatase family protein [Oscillatoria princeps RMCB-10]|jgi:endonuclease/exonuclease/phosphatase (EEP) superfamily protein YafD|nr:endonuclease/exonuclease/phosphatase family protein [Oscillatoria princeps RMCB-10]
MKWKLLQKPTGWIPPVKTILNWGFMLAAVTASLCSLTGYLGELHFLLELTSHFKVQYLGIGFCTLFFFLMARKKAWCLVSLFCIAINLLEVVPWYLPQPASAGETVTQLRLLQSNVLTSNRQYYKVISLVRKEKPDVAVFIEVSKSWAKELEVLRESFPYVFLNQDGDYFGTAIYSKLPLANKSIKDLGGGRKTIMAEVTIQGQLVSLLASHPNIPTGRSGFKQRNKQLSELGNYVVKFKNPVVMVGDFNTTMWSPHYKKFVGKAGLRNARAGFGTLPTWPTFFPLLYIPIDHCLVSPEIEVVKIRRGREVGSDHLPLIADLAITRKAESN